MVECKTAPTMIEQRIGKYQCCEPRDNAENSHTSILNRWQGIFKNFLAYGEANAHKHDKYEPVLLGGGSYMLIRCEPEAIFREGK